MDESNATTMAEPEQTGLAMLPAIGLVNKQGSTYRVTDPDTLPEAWSWAQPALQKLRKELVPTGNEGIDALRNKLIRVFAQSHGQIVFTEGPLRHAVLYPVRDDDNKPGLSDPGFLRSAFKAALWVVEKTLNRSLSMAAGGFTAQYRNATQPSFRIAFPASSYVAAEDLIRTQLIEPTPPEHDGIQNLRLVSPLVHELTHAAVEAGHVLSGMDKVSGLNKKSLKDKAASKNRIVNTGVFRLLELMDAASINSIPAVVNTLPYQEWQKPEENLTHAVANRCGEAGQTPSPFMDRFIADIFSRDLDLILADDRQGRLALLDALKGGSSLYRNIAHRFAEASAKQADPEALQEKIAETISAAMAQLDNASSSVKDADTGSVLRQSARFPANPA
jgi:hypothetical protein